MILKHLNKIIHKPLLITLIDIIVIVGIVYLLKFYYNTKNVTISKKDDIQYYSWIEKLSNPPRRFLKIQIKNLSKDDIELNTKSEIVDIVYYKNKTIILQNSIPIKKLMVSNKKIFERRKVILLEYELTNDLRNITFNKYDSLEIIIKMDIIKPVKLVQYLN